MAQSPDHPELAFVQARYYAKGRPDGPPLWIVVHDMEASEYSGRAESTAEYFRTMTDGRTVSSHYCADNDSVVQCVLLADTAFTVGNRPGNYRGINWEFSGFARQTRAEWLDAFGLAMFRQAAPIIRSDMARFDIPLRRCSVSDLQARRPGITSHNDLRLAFGGTTHTDPGPNFPWDVFLQIVEGDDMPDWFTRSDWEAHIWRDHALINNLAKVAGGPHKGVEVNAVRSVLEALLAAVNGDDAEAILAAIEAQGTATRAALADLGPAITAAVLAGVDAELDEEQVGAAVAQALAARLAQ